MLVFAEHKKVNALKDILHYQNEPNRIMFKKKSMNIVLIVNHKRLMKLMLTSDGNGKQVLNKLDMKEK